ncbi:MAG: prepilin-type N-terminal cleavage/methylation domain-containing protein [Patescibacteria group bacterium]|nr:prepilin-type N-terminal cleavage/methylation domain-containing protein [Patescibacteria group bacterium]
MKGFTLIELLVSISIFAVVTGLVLAKYQSFNGGIILTNLAYEIALTIRETQTYGINVKGNLNDFNVAYGVHFDSSNDKSFVVFTDKQDLNNANKDTGISTGDGKYDGGTSGNDTKVNTFILKKGIVVEKFCVGSSIGNIGGLTEVCDDTFLDITFNRPDPSAVINATSGNYYGYARIQVKASGNGVIKDIIVQETGQISIQNGQ